MPSMKFCKSGLSCHPGQRVHLQKSASQSSTQCCKTGRLPKTLHTFQQRAVLLLPMSQTIPSSPHQLNALIKLLLCLHKSMPMCKLSLSLSLSTLFWATSLPHGCFVQGLIFFHYTNFHYCMHIAFCRLHFNLLSFCIILPISFNL